MPTLRLPLHAAALALLAACSSGGNLLSVTNYDTSCQQDSDCIPVTVGTLGCCACANAAINKSDEAKYQADAVAAERGQGVCNVDCAFLPGCEGTAACAQGTCALTQPPDGGVADGG